MRLVELEPRFKRLDGSYLPDVDTLEQAQGVWFLCPKCFHSNGGAVGTHMILCWFSGRDVPAEAEPGPGRWEALGTGLGDLTLRGTPLSSVLLRGGCGAHFHINGGEIQPCEPF